MILAPVHPNAGLGVSYQRKLEKLVDEMHASTVYWIMAAYRANKPEMALDASPAGVLKALFRKLGRYWMRKFDDMGPALARYFAVTAHRRADGALAAILKKAGWTVAFKLTRPANDVLQAAIAENVALISNIAEKHLADIEGIVMRSVQMGGNLQILREHLEQKYQMTRKRATFIALDQNSKATAVITRVRQAELHITQAIWLHSTAGKVPRPDHLEANGKIYDTKTGAFADGTVLDDGPGIYPGQLINCRCVSRSILPSQGIPSQWREKNKGVL